MLCRQRKGIGDFEDPVKIKAKDETSGGSRLARMLDDLRDYLDSTPMSLSRIIHTMTVYTLSRPAVRELWGFQPQDLLLSTWMQVSVRAQDQWVQVLEGLQAARPQSPLPWMSPSCTLSAKGVGDEKESVYGRWATSCASKI
jgi:hypothetical protein